MKLFYSDDDFTGVFLFYKMMTTTTDQIIDQVLSAYPKDFQAEDISLLDPSSALGSCRHWLVNSPEERFCLRQWKKGEPTQNRLQFIQAVIWTAAYEGLDFVPLPLETAENKGFVDIEGCFWELLPWFETTFSDQREFQVTTSMMSLAQFHLAVADFPLPDLSISYSLYIQSILSKWESWISGRIPKLYRALQQNDSNFPTPVQTRLAKTGLHFLRQVLPLTGNGMVLLTRAARLAVPIQPVIGNAVLRHVYFDTDGVCGMIDFKEIAADSVSRDVASLLGSIAESDALLWTLGLQAYQSIRSLSDNELFLVQAFDRTQIILEGLEYLSNIFLDEKVFTDLQLSEILRRVESFVMRLEDEKRSKNIA